MARKPANGNPASHERTPSDREKIIAAFLGLLAEKPIERIGFADVAGRAEVSLATLRGEFASLLAIYAAHVREIDRKVLAGGEAEMAEEPPRERLFDVLMRRLEALAPHKEAIRSLLRSVRRNPGLAFALNGLAVRSQQWMLTAAGIGAAGPRGMLRAQGARADVRARAAHLRRRRRSRPRPHHGGARPCARPRPALGRLPRRPLPLRAARGLRAAAPPAPARRRRAQPRSRRRRADPGMTAPATRPAEP